MYKQLVTVLLMGTCSLGSPKLIGRIIGGENANIEDYPYQVSLEFNGEHECGGAIISDIWVVTAAHCVQGKTASELRFRAGSSIRGSGGTLHPAEQIILHPYFVLGLFDTDIAVVKVSVPFIYGPGIQAISLAISEPAGGEMATVTGWGITNINNESLPKHLQALYVPIVDRQECKNLLGFLTKNMLCAGIEDGKGVCTYDSGGPLAVAGKLVGIVNFSAGCAKPQKPAVYADISVLRDFVVSKTGSIN